MTKSLVINKNNSDGIKFVAKSYSSDRSPRLDCGHSDTDEKMLLFM